MTTIHGLKPSSVALLVHLQNQIAEHGIAPTYQQMADAMGCSLTNIGINLGFLEARGYLTRPGQSQRKARRVTLTGKPWPPATTTNPTNLQTAGTHQ